MSQRGGRLPYPGLRSFTREETDLFFGREGSVDAMVDRLAATRFLAVLGASGSGKSSLVRTGLLDALELGLLHKAGSRWLIADFRPGDAPVANMAEGLLRAAAPDPTGLPDDDDVRLLRAFLARGPRSVVEWCEADNLPDGANLLLLVDQFEELFRYSEYSEREEAEAFVGLLLESARVPLDQARIYVAITMRSEYLGAAALIDGLAEAINKGLYLTPRMGRDQVREAIVGPAAVCGFAIEPALTNRLLNDLTSFAPWEEEDKGNQLERLVRRADQLPLMQHVLNRLWSLATARNEADPVVLKLEDYNTLGGLRGALDAHGHEILEELLPEHKEVASSVFRALTTGSSLADAVRRPTEFGELVAIAGGDEIAVREVVEAFRAPGRNFLVPPRPTPLRSTTVIDISHESLIRQWAQFAGWLQREIGSAAAWRRLVDAAERFERGEANLLSGLALAGLASWWDTEQPTAAWAKRYGGDFEGAQAFLEQSRQAEEASKGAEAEERRQKARNRAITWAAIVILCIIAPLTVFAGYSAVRANREAETALQERQEAEAQRQLALVAQEDAVKQAEEAEAQRKLAEEERQRAEIEQRKALDSAALAESERQRANAERALAREAERVAREQATAAAEAQRLAEIERQNALQSAALAESERQRANAESVLAREAERVAREQAAAAAEAQRLGEIERQNAIASAARAEAERQRADRERALAREAERVAMEQATAAATAQRQAEAERIRAVALADEAREQRLAAEAQKRIADTERTNRRLEVISNRAASLQQGGAWDASASLLGTLWRDHIEAGARFHGSWLIDSTRASFQRQTLAEYPVLPDFLTYAGLEGWSGSSGRFRVYSLAAKPLEAGGPAPGHRTIAIYDAMTGAVTGRFDLPPGKDLGTKLDLVAPDGRRAAIVTDSDEIALWAQDREGVTLVPVPQEAEAAVDVSQLAPVSTDGRFALYLTYDGQPGAVVAVEPAAQAITFSLPVAELAAQAGVDSITSLQLLGLAGDQLALLVNDPDGRIVTISTATGELRDFDVGGAVRSALLTPDGQVLLALTCRGQCREQHLVAADVATNATLWVEKVPIGMAFVERAARLRDTAGAPIYDAAVENKGDAIFFEFGATATGTPLRSDGLSQARIGEAAFNGAGGYRTITAASADNSGGSLAPVGTLATYRVPEKRQKLSLYVAPNSVAIHEGDEGMRVAGVDHAGDLLVYRVNSDGTFEEDAAFRPVQIGVSPCVASIAFAGDGRSLLVRHINGALRYIAAVGAGAGVGWRIPDPAGVANAPLQEVEPPTSCDTPEVQEGSVPERLVAVDEPGRIFALLDTQGDVWWINVNDNTNAAGETQPGRAAPAPVRDIGPVQRVASGMRWIAGDPARGRIVAVAQPHASADGAGEPEETAADTKDAGASAGPNDALVILDPGEPEGASGGRNADRSARLPQRGEPLAAVFDEAGALAVAYAGGQLAILSAGNGAWTVAKEIDVPSLAVTGLLTSKDRIAVVDGRHFVITADRGSGAVTGHGRLPANPSLIALRPDGGLLSVEYDTDSASSVRLAAPPAAAAINDTARLVTMRSRAEATEDSSIVALRVDESSPSDPGSQSFACAERVALYLAGLEAGILGGDAIGAAAAPSDCAPAAGGATALVDVAEALAARAVASSVGELVRDESLSIVLQTAAGGDTAAMRILGAVLARIAAARAQAEPAEIALDSVRFGTGFAPQMLQAIAAGAPISPEFIEASRARRGFDPMAHQLLGHALERQINDIGSLGEALFEFSLAERLYQASGRQAEADYAGYRRAQLARILPDKSVLELWARLEMWRPELAAERSTEVGGIPGDPVARRAEDMQNADRLAEMLPHSLLLEVIRTEFIRAEILSLAESDPKAAVDRLLEIGPQSGGESGWSPDLIREYLDLAEELAGGRDKESGFRLAAAALQLVGGAFQSPIHANAEAVELFRRAAAVFAATANTVPKDRVAAEAGRLDLELAQYAYGKLPPLDGKAENAAAEVVLASAASVFKAAAATGEDAPGWTKRQAEALFWQGVVTNNHDWDKATEALSASRDLLRPIVERDPQDWDARFRYAEALRWMGLSSESTPQAVETEREAVRQYSELWQKRGSLNSELLAAAGIGYGFALANLPQTLREVNLADLQDGRGAEDHAPWVLEVLALAAEKDAVNAHMIETGAAAGDSEFVNGWYRMSSFGWSLAFLSGLAAIESGMDNVSQCDVLASDPYDARRRAPGLNLTDVDLARAEAECRSAHEASPEDHRTAYQLARVISADTNRSAEFLPLATEAAEQGISAAATLVGSTLEQKNDDRNGQAYMAASQNVIIESFAILHPYLVGRATSDRDRSGLSWYAQRAADLGVPEAHMTLAGAAADDVTKDVHLRIAARLWDAAGDVVAANEARRQADALALDAGRAEEARTRIAEWSPEAISEIPTDNVGNI